MKSLARLIPFLYPYRYQVYLGFAAFFLSRFFESWTYLLVAEGIDTIAGSAPVLSQSGGGQLPLGWVTFGIVATVLARFVVVVYARRQIRRTGIAVSFDLRQGFYASLQRQSAGFFQKIGTGDAMTRAIQDISLVQRLISFGLIQLVIMVFAPLFAISIMLWKSPLLTLFILPLLPLIYLAGQNLGRAMGQRSQAVQKRLSELAGHVQENLSGIRTVQAMVQEENEIRRFRQTNDSYGRAFRDQAKIHSLMVAFLPWLASMAQVCILVVGGREVLAGRLSVGDLFIFFFFLNMLLQPIRMAGFFITLLQQARVSIDRLLEVMDAEPEIQDRPKGQVPRKLQGNLVLRDLSFRYPGAAGDALSHINLEIQAGETLGIVGRVGAGKSTLLKLFTRMVNTPRGTLYLDGHDICDYPLARLREIFAQVLQDSFLFAEPLYVNISYDDPERAGQLIWDSADAAALRQTVEQFPEQMQTLVGERGLTLSGGQRQRTSLARGLIQNAGVLLLDDCFSSVDTETEEHILGHLHRLRKGRTTILVSHRVSTLRRSDRILVLDAGRIAEIGTHEALLLKGGIYAELQRAQAGQKPAKPELTRV